MDTYAMMVVVFLVTAGACVLLAKWAAHIAWLDYPNSADHAHKQHSKAVPPVGGVAMWLGVLTAVWLQRGAFSMHLMLYLGSSGFLLLVGLVDDVRGLSARARFVLQMLCVLWMVHCGVGLQHFGDLLGAGQVRLGPYAVVATVIAVSAMINAYNMLDGLDGLCGGQVAWGCLGLAAYLWMTGHLVALQVHMLLLAVVVFAFLCCNGPLKWRCMPRIFMGDAGSTMWGFVLAWWMMQVSQVPHGGLPPAACLWLVALPLWDATRLILIRAWRRQPVMGADRLHVHHILRDLGLSSRVVCFMLWALSLACVWLGCFFVRHRAHEVLIFWSFIAAFVVYACVFSGLSIRCRPENQPSGGCL